jgi:sec-independent protein translocase protein TatA
MAGCWLANLCLRQLEFCEKPQHSVIGSLGTCLAFYYAMIGWPEIVGMLVVVLVLFGAKKVPELARGLGQGIREFKKATREVQDEIERAVEDPPRQVTRESPDHVSSESASGVKP